MLTTLRKTWIVETFLYYICSNKMFNQKLKIMKLKVLLFATLFAFGFLSVNAQTSTFNKGDKVVNLCVGFGSGYYGGGGYSSVMPAVSGSLDIGILDDILEKGSIGVGGIIGYSSASYDYVGYGWKYTHLVVAARGTFHYPLVDKLDTYAGLALGYNAVSAKETGNWPGSTEYSAKGSSPYFAGFIGARYYFSDSFAGVVELGSGIAYFNVGVALKF